MSLYCREVWKIQDSADDLLEATNQYYDVFLSDLSPRVSGIWHYDHVRQISLSLNALQLVSRSFEAEEVPSSKYLKVKWPTNSKKKSQTILPI